MYDSAKDDLRPSPWSERAHSHRVKSLEAVSSSSINMVSGGWLEYWVAGSFEIACDVLYGYVALGAPWSVRDNVTGTQEAVFFTC